MDNEDEFIILMDNIRSSIAVIALSGIAIAVLLGVFIIFVAYRGV